MTVGMTLTEKILAAHCGKTTVRPGETINVKVDFVIGNEASTLFAIEDMKKLGCDSVFDPDRVCIIADHMTPNRGIDEAGVVKINRDFNRRMKITNYFEVGQGGGICHVVVPDKGLVTAGEVCVGADSHTCTYGALGAFASGMGSTDIMCALVLGEIWMRVPETIKLVYTGKLPKGITGKDLILRTIGLLGVEGARYKALEFSGEPIADLSMDSRFTMANMVIEAGAKNGLFPVDGKTLEYLEGRSKRPFTVYGPDADAEYERVIEIDVTGMEPQVALPHMPDNVKPISKASPNGKIQLDQVFLGSCVGGRREDMTIAAGILRGRKVSPNLRLIVIPGSQEIFGWMASTGIMAEMVEAGACICPPSCGPCGGRNLGILGAGEKCASTTNRNFRGRMGHMDSEVYLVGPQVAAASAVLGWLASPGEVL